MKFLFNFIILTFVSNLYSLTLSTEKIAYCDIEKVFESYSLTKISREQLEKEKEKMEEAIRKLESEIAEIKEKIKKTQEIKVSSFTVTSATKTKTDVNKNSSTKNVAISTMTLPGLSLEEELKKKEKDLEEKKRSFQKELEKKEEDIKEQIIYRIYTTVEEVANEIGATVVFDKSQVIYSSTILDITDKVIERLQEKFK